MTTIVLLLAIGLSDPCVSGVPVGKRPGPYSFLVATGPERGKQHCFICEQEVKPTAVVFARTLTPALGKLLSGLEAEVPKRKESGFKVWMTQVTEKADLDGLAKWSQKQGLKSVPVGAFEDTDGPPAYKLNRDADVTILLFVNEKVVANFAFRPDELTDDAIQTVVKRLPELFEKK